MGWFSSLCDICTIVKISVATMQAVNSITILILGPEFLNYKFFYFKVNIDFCISLSPIPAVFKSCIINNLQYSNQQKLKNLDQTGN